MLDIKIEGSLEDLLIDALSDHDLRKTFNTMSSNRLKMLAFRVIERTKNFSGDKEYVKSLLNISVFTRIVLNTESSQKFEVGFDIKFKTPTKKSKRSVGKDQRDVLSRYGRVSSKDKRISGSLNARKDEVENLYRKGLINSKERVEQIDAIERDILYMKGITPKNRVRGRIETPEEFRKKREQDKIEKGKVLVSGTRTVIKPPGRLKKWGTKKVPIVPGKASVWGNNNRIVARGTVSVWGSRKVSWKEEREKVLNKKWGTKKISKKIDDTVSEDDNIDFNVFDFSPLYEELYKCIEILIKSRL